MVLNCPNGFMSIKDPISKSTNYYACKPSLTPSSFFCPEGGIQLDDNHYACKLPLSENGLSCPRGIKYIMSDTITCN